MPSFKLGDPRRTNVAARFWNKVVIPDDPNACWEFAGGRLDTGYGIFSIDDRSIKAHRAGWELVNGRIPNDLMVLHSCDNPPCVNPHHLFLGTGADNQRDAIAKGRKKSRSDELGGNSKLKKSEVKEIRRLYATGKITYADLSRMFGVSESNIFYIAARQTWKHTFCHFTTDWRGR